MVLHTRLIIRWKSAYRVQIGIVQSARVDSSIDSAGRPGRWTRSQRTRRTAHPSTACSGGLARLARRHFGAAEVGLEPAWLRGFRPTKRRGRDLNPRRTLKPETVFETAAFDRSATPPSERTGPGGPASHGEGGIRTLDGAIQPHNALAGRRLQPLGHFSGPADGTARHWLRWPPAAERCPSGLRSATGNRVRAERSVAGSNPALSAASSIPGVGMLAVLGD